MVALVNYKLRLRLLVKINFWHSVKELHPFILFCIVRYSIRSISNGHLDSESPSSFTLIFLISSKRDDAPSYKQTLCCSYS